MKVRHQRKAAQRRIGDQVFLRKLVGRVVLKMVDRIAEAMARRVLKAMYQPRIDFALAVLQTFPGSSATLDGANERQP